MVCRHAQSLRVEQKEEMVDRLSSKLREVKKNAVATGDPTEANQVTVTAACPWAPTGRPISAPWACCALYPETERKRSFFPPKRLVELLY